MKWTSQLLALAAVAAPLVSAADSKFKPDKNGKYQIGDVEDNGLEIHFVAYGAAVSNLFVKDKSGIKRDLVMGYDTAKPYHNTSVHPHLNGIPGRYANRIKNSSFTIDGETYHTTANENPTEANPDGIDTLHGGLRGWDWRDWEVKDMTNSSITFFLHDEDGSQGFPGDVDAYVTYNVDGMDWDWKMMALPMTKKTPIMMSSHGYWNLDGFANNMTSSALNHTFHLPYGGQRVGVDNILIPTGDIVANKKGSVNDFWSEPKQLGASFGDDEIHGNCGFNCTGYDTCFITNRDAIGPYDWKKEGPVATLASKWSGITLDIYSNQDAFQIYTCNSQDGSNPLKSTQGSDKYDGGVPQYGCVVLEVEDWIDGINQPEWGRDSKQIFGPEDSPYVLEARYSFSVDKC